MRPVHSYGSMVALGLLVLASLTSCDPPEPPVDPPVPVPVSPAPAVSAEDAAAALEALGRGRHLFLVVRDEPAAVETLRAAVALDPTLVAAHVMLGKTLLSMAAVWFGTKTLDRERLAESVLAFRQAFALAPDDPEAAYWLGYALFIGGEIEEGRARLEDALALDPDHAQAHKQLGLLYAGEGFGEEAKRHLLRAHGLLRKDAEVLFAYSLELESDGDLEGALESLEQTAELHPSLPAVYARMRAIHQRMGNEAAAAKAREDYEHWRDFARSMNAARDRVEQRRDDPEALFELGRLFAEAGMNDQAEIWMRRAAERAPERADLAAALADLRARLEAGQENQGAGE